MNRDDQRSFAYDRCVMRLGDGKYGVGKIVAENDRHDIYLTSTLDSASSIRDEMPEVRV